ncbi:DEAD-box ATP-dependent RNA helicase CshA [compost metagenome]
MDAPTAAIIFCKTKKGVDELVASMQARGYSVEGMHGDLSQNYRMNTLKKFKEGNLEFLVATDVAARGIDVENVTHVINYDLPQDTESYVHRIGRTGRANREGVAYTLVTPREYRALKQIERITNSKIKRKNIPTIDDIFEAKYNNIYSRIKETIEGEDYSKFIPLAEQIDEEFNLVQVAASLMHISYNKEVSYD